MINYILEKHLTEYTWKTCNVFDAGINNEASQ